MVDDATKLDGEILAAVARVFLERSDSEATDRPVWWIITPRRPSSDPGAILSQVLGPFWSRERAEQHLAAKAHRFTPKSRVYCGSAHDNPELRLLYDLSRKKHEMQRKASGEYYILDTRGRGDWALWWGPDSKGYTEDLAAAGLYSESEIRGLRDTDKAIPRDVADRLMVSQARVWKTRLLKAVPNG